MLTQPRKQQIPAVESVNSEMQIDKNIKLNESSKFKSILFKNLLYIAVMHVVLCYSRVLMSWIKILYIKLYTLQW